MISFDFILHHASYSVPLFLMWDSSLHYKKYKASIKKYNILFCPHYSLWIISTSGMGLGRTQFASLFARELGHPFHGPILYYNFATSNKVFGVDALRVIDGSTFLRSPGTNYTQATVVMLGR